MYKTKRLIMSVLILTLLALVSGCGKTEINLNDYIEISTSDDYDGQAFAYVSIDYDSIFTLIHEEDEIDELSLLSEYVALEEAIDANLDKSEMLYNGDVLHLTWVIDDEYAKENKLKLISEDFDYTVTGLKEIKEIDLLEDIEVTYNGISPAVSAKVNTNSEYLSASDIIVEPSRNLAIGSTIKITINKEDDYFLKKGVRPTVKEREITIVDSDVDSYIVSLDQLADDEFNTMDTIILNNIESRMEDEEKFFLIYSKYDMTIIKNLFPYDKFLDAGRKTSYVSHTTPKLVSTYLLTQYTETSSRNVLYRVFETEITDEIFGTYTVVFVGDAENLIKYKDGTIHLDASHLEIAESNIKCYTSLDSFETQCIEPKKIDYTVEKK